MLNENLGGILGGILFLCIGIQFKLYSIQVACNDIQYFSFEWNLILIILFFLLIDLVNNHC